MEPMDPIALSSLSSLLRSALQQKDLTGVTLESIFKGAGPDLLLRYLGQGAEGARLELPNGVVISAKGSLPFPEGTQLKVMLEKGGDVLALKTLEATPPAAAPLLAPLAESEASALLNRLLSLEDKAAAAMKGPIQERPAEDNAAHKSARGDSAHGLMPGREGVSTVNGQQARQPDLAMTALSRLFRIFSDLSSLQGPGISSSVLRQSLLQLGESERKNLLMVLDLPMDATPDVIAERLSALLKAGVQDGGVLKEKAALSSAMAAFLTSLQKRGLSPQNGKLLEGCFDKLLAGMGLTEMSAPPAMGLSGRAFPGEAQEPGNAKASVGPQGMEKALGALLEKGDAERLSGALQGRAHSVAEAPEAWEAWVKGGIRVLSDPAASPQEAPFHILQAKENTAFFELPLPWPGAGPLQIWVEDDAPERPSGEGEPVQRVLLSLCFSRLGQTRVGFMSQGGVLSVRIWTEHPELLAEQQGAMEKALAEVASSVSCRVFPLDPEAADPRSLLGGTAWMGMA